MLPALIMRVHNMCLHHEALLFVLNIKKGLTQAQPRVMLCTTQALLPLQVRPTADRGPILLCIDTSGSMRGARETVAKALSLECMRAAKAQERGCYVFAFAGPQEVCDIRITCRT